MPPPAPAASALIEMLNVLEGYDLAAMGSAIGQRRSPDDRGDEARRTPIARTIWATPTSTGLPVAKLISKQYAADLRKTIDEKRTQVVLADHASSGRTRATKRRTSRWSTAIATRCR